jgi:hypothetical protein
MHRVDHPKGRCGSGKSSLARQTTERDHGTARGRDRQVFWQPGLAAMQRHQWIVTNGGLFEENELIIDGDLEILVSQTAQGAWVRQVPYFRGWLSGLKKTTAGFTVLEAGAITDIYSISGKRDWDRVRQNSRAYEHETLLARLDGWSTGDPRKPAALSIRNRSCASKWASTRFIETNIQDRNRDSRDRLMELIKGYIGDLS